jgi:hypothetical protein
MIPERYDLSVSSDMAYTQKRYTNFGGIIRFGDARLKNNFV